MKCATGECKDGEGWTGDWVESKRRRGRVRTRDELESRTYVDHGRKNYEISAPIGDHGQQRDRPVDGRR